MGAFGAPVSAADFPQKAGILGPGRQCCPTRLALVARRILSGREQTGKGYASKEAQGEEESVIVEAVMADNEAHSYFSGDHTVTIPMEGYDDIIPIPACEPSQVDEAISQAVAQGLIWMTNGPASILGEPIPAGILSPSAVLRPPPEPIVVSELMAQEIPDAWKDDKTNALAILTSLSHKRGANLPWSTVRTVIGEGIRSRWLELSTESAAWPSELAGAQNVVLRKPEAEQDLVGERDRYSPRGLFVAEAALEGNGIQDLADQIPDILEAAVGYPLEFRVRIEFGGETAPDQAKVDKINALLSEASEDLKLGKNV